MNIALFLEMAAEVAADRVGLVCDGRRWTYGELLAAARDGEAQSLMPFRVGIADSVPKSVAYLIGKFFACTGCHLLYLAFQL